MAQLHSQNIPVYHLEGGVLAYLQQVPPEKSEWEGECYVFDQRVAVSHGLKPSQHYTNNCHACRHPLSKEEENSDAYEEGISCPYCINDPARQQRRDRYSSRQEQMTMNGKDS